jgi:hypothetical protein
MTSIRLLANNQRLDGYHSDNESLVEEHHHSLSPLIKKISRLAIIETNERLKLGVWGFDMPLKEFIGADNQTTQALTKMLQYLVNKCIKEVIDKLNITAKQIGSDGFDYVFTLNGVDYRVEFKLIAGTDSMKASFATGNKISANKDENGNSIGKKSPLLWSIKYVMGEDNQITDYASVFINCERFFNEISGWKAGSGKNDSYSNMQIAKDELLCVDVLHGHLHKADKWYHLLPESINV